MYSANVKKFTVVPLNQVGGNNDQEPEHVVKTRNRKSPHERLEKAIRIVLNIANVNGYDKEFRIKTVDGAVVQGSDLVLLLNHSLSYGRLLKGESEFIDLLHKASVDPELITNDNVKAKLVALYDRKVRYVNTATKPKPRITETFPERRPTLKRKLSEEPPPLSPYYAHDDEDEGADVVDPPEAKKRKPTLEEEALDAPLPEDNDQEGFGWEVPPWVT